MRSAVAIVVVVAACKNSEKTTAMKGPAPVASCDYRDDAGHRCLDIFDETTVVRHEAWCNEREHPMVTRHGCPSEGRHGGCLYPNGTIEWRYSGSAECVGGHLFSDAPARKTAMPYRCTTQRFCQETTSVFDLASVDKKNCEALGGSFAAGSCPTHNVVGRCLMRERARDTLWFYYVNEWSTEGAREHCGQMAGEMQP